MINLCNWRYTLVKIVTPHGRLFRPPITDLAESLRAFCLKSYGDVGLASVQSLKIKYIDEISPIFIVRLRHGPHRFMTSIFPLLKQVIIPDCLLFGLWSVWLISSMSFYVRRTCRLMGICWNLSVCLQQAPSRESTCSSWRTLRKSCFRNRRKYCQKLRLLDCLRSALSPFPSKWLSDHFHPYSILTMRSLINNLRKRNPLSRNSSNKYFIAENISHPIKA